MLKHAWPNHAIMEISHAEIYWLYYKDMVPPASLGAAVNYSL